MKKIFFCCLFIIPALLLSAKAPDANEAIKSVNTNLKNTILPALKAWIQVLDVEIDKAKSDSARFSGRSFIAANALISAGPVSNNPEKFFEQFATLKDFYKAVGVNSNPAANSQYKKFSKLQDSDLKRTYELILEMEASLDKCYAEDVNDDLIKRSKEIMYPLRKHSEELTTLTNQINDYSFYMYELGRMMRAAEEGSKSITAEDLVAQQEAPYLLDVPFIKRVLDKYLSKGLSQTEAETLYNSLPDAFPNLKQ